MYLKFNKDGNLFGKSFKKDEVRYETKGKKFVEAGVAEEINYEEEHKKAKPSSVNLKDSKPESDNE